MTEAGLVYIVDDEPGMRKALTRLLVAEGFDVLSFPSADEFLAAVRPAEPGCLVLDVAMPGTDGLTLQTELGKRGIDLPILFLTGHGDIPMSVRAMKAGAVDFLAKPVDDAVLLKEVREALALARARRASAIELESLRRRLDSLTPREREVLEHLLAGKLNKQIAAALGTVEKTIKVHRGRVMQKMKVQSVAELVHIAEKAGIEGRGTRGEGKKR